MIYIGIDPGQKGGIATLTDCSSDTRNLFPMPETRAQLYAVLKGYTKFDASVTAIVESVHSMPKQGVASTFKFGKGYGEILGICTALGFRIIEPTPQAWKKAMLAGTDKSKEAAVKVCENLFPGINLIPPRCRKAHDGMAEALLLAEYGRRLNL